MNVVALVMGLGLGAGAMAVVHEVCRWDAERRLARRLGRGSSAAAAAAADPPVTVPAGRHHRGGLAAVPVWDGGGQKIAAADPDAWVYA